MILVLSTHSSYTGDDSWILTKLLVGISWSRNKVFSIMAIVAFHAQEGEEGVVSSRWHQGSFSLHVSTHDLQAFLVDWVADNEWMMC